MSPGDAVLSYKRSIERMSEPPRLVEKEDPMSAAVAWDDTIAPARVPGRPRLHLVPTGDAVPAQLVAQTGRKS